MNEIEITKGPTKKEIIQNLFSKDPDDRKLVVFYTAEGKFLGHLNGVSRRSNSGEEFCFDGDFKQKLGGKITRYSKVTVYYHTGIQRGYIVLVKQ